DRSEGVRGVQSGAEGFGVRVDDEGCLPDEDLRPERKDSVLDALAQIVGPVATAEVMDPNALDVELELGMIPRHAWFRDDEVSRRSRTHNALALRQANGWNTRDS